MARLSNLLRRPVGVLGGLLLTCLAMQAASPSLAGIYSFTGTNGDGANPYTGVILSSSGVLFGTTEYGGAAGYGSVFELTPPTGGMGPWTESVIHSFSSADGAYPYASLTLATNGTLYGCTPYGGSSGLGVVFQLTPPMGSATTWTLTVLHSFSGSDGTNPFAGLLLSSSGALFGTTELGGASNAGTVFKLTPPGTSGGPWSETVLYSFTGGKDGGYPYSGVTLGKGGVLYGTTNWGGASIYGTVFQLTPVSQSAWTESVLHSFTGNGDGGNPFANVTLASSTGVLYGTTAGGIGAGNGTVFKLTPPATTGGAWTEAVLYSFTGAADGDHPRGSISIGKSGVLYGTTIAGGSASYYAGNGIVFQLTPSSSTPWTETVLHTFSGAADGAYPSAFLTAAPNGSYYGTTLSGGSGGQGTVFNLIP